SDYGLTWGIFKRVVFNFFSFLPVMLVMGWLSGGIREFYDVYPYNPLAGISWRALITHSITYLFLYYLSWEFMFRGFIQLGLTQRLGAVPAVLVQTLASSMLHYGHPASETFGCVVGGLLWGFLVYRTKSILSGWGQHAVLGITLDWSLILKAI
ncbi:MAG: CPBP family intramembrane metalloprotease, partial [Thermoguttaceae bacterium]|nr:CPBP family intramembrane metalloprotease [Thermoguttaceae bacterium]